MNFTEIYLLESLPGGFAARTGWRLHEELETLVGASARKIDLHYKFIQTKEELFEALASMAAALQDGSRRPLLHLETHGNQEGLSLASGEFATWSDLQPALAAINVAARLNLIVVVAACNGRDLLKILQPTDRAVARLIIGPHRTLTDREIETATREFYSVLFRTFDGWKAFEAMNDVIEPPSDARTQLFDGLSAENIFQSVLHGFFRKYCTKEAIEAEVEAFLTRAALRGDGPQQLTKMGALFREERMNHRKHFEHYRRLFFFCDLQPENNSRFNVRFEDCWVNIDGVPAENV